MKATITRIFIFGLTVRTHDKRSHGSLRTIVRKVTCDRKTRAAMRTVGKSITPTTIPLGEHVFQTMITGCRIGCYICRDFPGHTLRDDEILIMTNFTRQFSNIVNAGQRRLLFHELLRELLNDSLGTNEINSDTFGIIENFANQPKFFGDTINGRTEPNALNKAVHSKITRHVCHYCLRLTVF